MKHLRERDEAGEFALQKFHRRAEQIDKRDRVILKNEEERQVFEEVFDRRTLMILYDLANRGAFSYLNGVISSGKEARVYWGVKTDGTDVAVKIYLVASSDYKKRMQYVVGDPRFNRFRRDSRGVAELWARKEFTNLKQCFDAGAPVPKPLAFLGNVVVMEFIGKEGLPAPRIVEREVTKGDYQQIVKALKTIYQKGMIVHADLSEYNVMKFEGKDILFDFGSAVSIEHPQAEEFLKRDIANLNRFFQKRNVSTIEDNVLLARLQRGVRNSKEKQVPRDEDEIQLTNATDV
ncbi:MAG TPA: serine protein kinase RIO [Nitrososphaerales archaeon]|nr:serine protein kinase RIO [Nitrososphaerales archaeon]